MKTKIILVWLGGVIVGAVTGGYFVGTACAKRYREEIEDLRDQNAKLCEDIYEKDVESLKKDLDEDFTGKYRMDNWHEWAKDYETAKWVVELISPGSIKEEEKSEVADEGTDKKEKEKKEKPPKIDYVQLSKQYRSESFDEHFADRAHPEDDEPEEDIYPIDYETFNQNLETYSWERMTWYQAEDILVDEVGDIVYDENETLGQEAIDILGDTKDDIIYVMNETRSHMYEVTVDHNSEFPYEPDEFNDSLYRDVML